MSNGLRKPDPIGSFFFKLFAAQTGQRVVLGATIVLAGLPLGCNPAFLLQFVQRRIQRTIADLQSISGYLLQALTDGPTIQRFERHNFQQQ